MSWLALLFLILSVAQTKQKRLRVYGVVSNILFMAAYINDPVIFISNMLVLALHCKWLYRYEDRAIIDYMRKRRKLS